MKYLLKKQKFTKTWRRDHGLLVPPSAVVRRPLYASRVVQQVYLITNNFSDTSNNGKINNNI